MKYAEKNDLRETSKDDPREKDDWKLILRPTSLGSRTPSMSPIQVWVKRRARIWRNGPSLKRADQPTVCRRSVSVD